MGNGDALRSVLPKGSKQLVDAALSNSQRFHTDFSYTGAGNEFTPVRRPFKKEHAGKLEHAANAAADSVLEMMAAMGLYKVPALFQ